MKIVSVASAFPKNYYSQQVLGAALRHYWAGKLDKPQLLEQFYARMNVDGRHLALPLAQYYGLETWGDFNAPGWWRPNN